MNNIIKRSWNQGSMTHIEDLQGSAFTNENGGHTFQISGVDSNGEALALSGTVAASFLRPDQTTVGISGSVSGGVASVTLSEECYGIPGRFGLVVFLTSDGKKTAIYSCVGNVARSSTDAVAPGVVADVVDLINEIQAAVDTIPASYSALMADIAPTYSSSALYAVGDYAWYDGDLKRCIVPITVGETYTPAHWTSAVVGDDVCALKSAINADTELSYRNSDNIEKILNKENVDYIIPCVFRDGVSRNQNMNINPVIDGKTISSQIIKTIKSTVSIKVPSGYKALVAKYTSDGSYAGFSPSSGFSASDFTAENVNPYTIVEVRRSDDSALTASSFDSSSIEVSFGQITNPIPAMDLRIAESEMMIGKIDSEIDQRAKKRGLSIWGLRSELDGEYREVSIPEGLSFLSGIDVSLFGDGYKFMCFADLSKYKNNSGNSYEANPSNLSSVISNANSGDTILLNDGVYSGVTITKSVNLIAKNPGKVIIQPMVTTGFEASAMENVYSSPVSGSGTRGKIYDMSLADNGIVRELTRVNSTSGLSTKGTYYYGSKIYVHLYDDSVPDEKKVFIDSDINASLLISPTENATVYVEGIDIRGGKNAVYYANTSAYTNQKLFMKDCKCRYSSGSAGNGITLLGVCGYFQNCDVSFNYRDGFNYHASNDVKSYGLEINCIAHDNGYIASSEELSNNGSTVHDGGKAMRINGIYYNNFGGNVADITSGTVTYNYGCVAFDSNAVDEGQSGDFWTSSNGVMYLYGCRAIGDKSKYNLYAVSGFIYFNNTEYDTKSGNNVRPV